MATVVQSAVETSRPVIEAAEHELLIQLPDVPIFVEADPTRLAQVFSNLLNNSAKYTERGGNIWLTAEWDQDEVVVRVRDNGIGIPPDALPRLFQMFSQVDRHFERAQGGLGIGLTLVRRLVEMHGGTVAAHSAGTDRGSEFSVRLPVAPSGLPGFDLHAPVGPTSTAAAPARRILVVDDNRDSANSLSMMLKFRGNETCTAYDGMAAVEAAEAFAPDVILLDIGLPKLNGYDACRQIRQQPRSKGIVIIALTGWGQEDDRRRSLEAGFDHHMVKPVDPTELQHLLERGCGN